MRFGTQRSRSTAKRQVVERRGFEKNQTAGIVHRLRSSVARRKYSCADSVGTAYETSTIALLGTTAPPLPSRFLHAHETCQPIDSLWPYKAMFEMSEFTRTHSNTPHTVYYDDNVTTKCSWRVPHDAFNVLHSGRHNRVG